ncbi:hypothetical protein DPMN_066139 [Dreissena polymorpha]|uniref:Uncharacterized protein n=1 Tax=Dreissena polymorpha TaxID=45954 RepID=A0A9D3YX95_DREPO|nr:hypothetical protein DPMN_066139 [Dreissena polymorpha]
MRQQDQTSSSNISPYKNSHRHWGCECSWQPHTTLFTIFQEKCGVMNCWKVLPLDHTEA